jgi:hypothetical protein
MFVWFLYLSVTIQVSDVCVNVLSIIVFFSINFSFLGTYLFFFKFVAYFVYVKIKGFQKLWMYSGYLTLLLTATEVQIQYP